MTCWSRITDCLLLFRNRNGVEGSFVMTGFTSITRALVYVAREVFPPCCIVFGCCRMGEASSGACVLLVKDQVLAGTCL